MASELILVGLGLSGVDGITVKALEALKLCDKVYAEFYTSFLINTNTSDIEKAISKKIEVLCRKQVEEESIVIRDAQTMCVGFITAGDVMAATTHVDLRIQARELDIPVRIFHGVSIFSACPSSVGLQPYKFGRTITIPFLDGDYQPRSPYDHILENKKRGLHTMILLDIHADEMRYMTAKEAIEWLIMSEKRWKGGLINENTLLVVASQVGSSNEKITAGYVKDLINMNLGEPLFTIILPGSLHYMEQYSLVYFAKAPEEVIEKE
ncbi:MAG: diphthine synthase [archaeon]|nr:diphthine synthase [archaeon]